MGSPPTKTLKKRIITWTLIFAVLVLAFLGILRLGLHYSSDILFQLVKRETNGYYQLSFEEIDIDIWERAIKLKKVLLKPDSSKDFYAKGLSNLYDLELAGLNIDLESLSSIYMERELAIRNVRIIDPQLHIIREKNAPDESFSLQTGNLYKEISAYLKVLRIDFFNIENAGFQQSPSKFDISNIDFSVKNLLIDSASRPDKKFYSESIELEIHNQSFKLGDGIHQLSFDRLLLSTTDSVLTFEKLVLKPLTKAHGTFDALDDKIVYDITIPKLELKGVDYFSAYRKNHLDMEELSLTGSSIFLEEQTHNKKDKSVKKGNSLLKQLIEVFDEVRIGKMRLINTNLDIITNDDYEHDYQHVQSKRADIVLYNFFLDSSNYNFDHREKYFDDVDIIIKDYSSYLPDSVHTINFDLLQLSSFDSTLVFNNFKISNNGQGSASDMFLSIDLPKLSLKGLNYIDILIHKKLLIDEMRLQYPNIIFEKKHSKSKKNEFSPDLIYAMIEENFKIVGIKKLQLHQGMFSINDQINFERTNLLVTNFNLHNKSNSWYDVLDDVKLDMQNMALNDKTIHLKAGRLKLDRMASRLILDDLSIDYLDENKSVSGDLSNLTISGIDLDSISLGNYLSFDTIGINNPQIMVDVLKPNEDSAKSVVLGEKYIEVVNGKINGKTHDAIAFSLNKVNTKLTLGAINNIHYGHAEQISITLPKSANQLNIKDLTLTESQGLFINNIELHSIQDTLLHRVELNGSLPAITLHGFNQSVFWQENKLVGDSLIIETPDLNLNLNDVSTAHAPKNTFEIEFQKVILEKAHLVFSDKGQSAVSRIETPQLSLTLAAFQYPQKSVLSADHLMYADDVTLSVKNLQPTMTNGDSVIIRQLSFNRQEAIILIDTLSFDKADSSTTTYFPHIRMVGLDLDTYLNEQRLALDSIQMIASQISIDHKGSKMDKQPPLKGIPKSVDVKYFSSIETEIALKDSLHPMGYDLHKGKFEVHEFYVEGDIIWNQFLTYSEFATISGTNLSIPLGDGYTLSIDQYDLQHPKNTLMLDNINFTSALTAAQYSSNLTAQKDWFDVSVEGITFSGLDYERLLTEREYYADKILVDGLNGLVYRDKWVPFQSLVAKKLPQTMLQDIEAWFYIDTLQVNGDITYQEKPAGKEEIAEISFNSIDASVFQITSVDSMALLPMQFVAKGRLVDTANFEINVLFDMDDPKDRFVFSGQIDKMELTALNKMLRPAANINIKDGYAERISFNIDANNELARGDMSIRYDNLKIQILNPETNHLKSQNQGFKTFFANTFVVKRKNPHFLLIRLGIIFQHRDSSRAIFQYWAKSLLSGAVSSIGINKSKKAEKKYGKKKQKENR
jgi:hypothetical protein